MIVSVVILIRMSQSMLWEYVLVVIMSDLYNGVHDGGVIIII